MQVDLFNCNHSKENSSPNINYQNHEENNLQFQIKDKLRNSYIPIIHSALKNKLEMINEKDEDNYNSNNTQIKDDFEINQNPYEIINNLKKKIILLENQIINLKKKNDNLRKENIENDSKIRRMSFIGTRRNFLFGCPGSNNIEFAELIKEKNDLQEINEKMLNMLTEKELENEELQENFDNYKSDIKKEITKYLEQIDSLEEKIEILEENNQNYH